MATKPWQIIVIVLGLLVGGGLIAWSAFSGDTVHLEYSMTLIDAETGEAYSIADYRSTRVILPAARPGTKDQYALIPIEKDEKSGQWRLGENAKRMVGAISVPIKAFDTASGELTAQPSAFKKYTKD